MAQISNYTSNDSWISYEILDISLSLGQARVSSRIFYQCYNSKTKTEDYPTGYQFSVPSYGQLNHSALYQFPDLSFGDRPFWLNTKKNKFTVIGCNTLGYLLLDATTNYSVGCLSSCDSLHTVMKYGSCSGIGCCQTAISRETNWFYVDFDERYNNSEVYNFSHCSYAMVVEEAEFNFNTTYITTDVLRYSNATLPIVIDWAIGNMTCGIAQSNKSSYACRSDHSVCLNSTSGHGGYLCNCSHGYQGNPYLEGGCQDIDECANQDACSKPGKCHNFQGGYRCSCSFGWRTNHNNPGQCNLNVALVIGTAIGVVVLSFLVVGIYVVLQGRNLSKVKEKYFQQHGGWILLEKIKSNQGFGFTIFTKQQVEQATNNFGSANILGRGGQGTVYRGTLKDQTVAIKKCKFVDESKKKEFGKEMLILSQINHKNIVKILGCCLEVEVPMLVYEFIPNGTLYHYIHFKKKGSHISLATRLRIAHESAEALAYLHTSASPPIFHGDVKSANILLDKNYTAKVSDFGASILVPTDEAQFVTLVQGTCGYLDPEYMQSSQLTDKSDVYSFGVVLLELLTSKPVIDFDAPEKERNLSSRFLSAMEENKMKELVDDEIKHEDDMGLIWAVAELAKECLCMKREERPMMKNVAEELHRISKLKHHPWEQEYNTEETETLLSEQSRHDNDIELTSNYINIDQEAEESIAIGR
ncbi:putative wall-associated receptor kinase-like 16 [Carex littledalei]|uniref:Putative wall-associated receptor kinase-like 16 n=1 Tax=Carex littledalei TaxID=544730 RepID=A0A833RG43_9POAL|nr:putative wall-associated receptor kinase-like 16 [Carex littledalei]